MGTGLLERAQLKSKAILMRHINHFGNKMHNIEFGDYI